MGHSHTRTRPQTLASCIPARSRCRAVRPGFGAAQYSFPRPLLQRESQFALCESNAGSFAESNVQSLRGVGGEFSRDFAGFLIMVVARGDFYRKRSVSSWDFNGG